MRDTRHGEKYLLGDEAMKLISKLFVQRPSDWFISDSLPYPQFYSTLAPFEDRSINCTFNLVGAKYPLNRGRTCKAA